MWVINDIWDDYTGNYHIELECSECGKKVGYLDAIGKTIKPCDCGTNAKGGKNE